MKYIQIKDGPHAGRIFEQEDVPASHLAVPVMNLLTGTIGRAVYDLEPATEQGWSGDFFIGHLNEEQTRDVT